MTVYVTDDSCFTVSCCTCLYAPALPCLLGSMPACWSTDFASDPSAVINTAWILSVMEALIQHTRQRYFHAKAGQAQNSLFDDGCMQAQGTGCYVNPFTIFPWKWGRQELLSARRKETLICGNLLVCEAVGPGPAPEPPAARWRGYEVSASSWALAARDRARVGDRDLVWDAESSVLPPFTGAHGHWNCQWETDWLLSHFMLSCVIPVFKFKDWVQLFKIVG